MCTWRQRATGLLVLLQVVLIAMVVSGCRSESTAPPATSSQQEQNWPQQLQDFRFRWSAGPGIELESGEAVPLRAYLESWLISYYADNVDDAYPGYLRATPADPEPGSPEWMKAPWELRHVRLDTSFHRSGHKLFGNEELHVLSIEPLESGFRAFVCDASFAVYEQTTGSTKFSPLYREASIQAGADLPNMQVWRIEFSDADPRVGAEPPASPDNAQRGPQPAPSTDVFGPWFVTGAQYVQAWGDGDAQASLNVMRQQCLDRYPLNADQRTKIATTVIDKSPAVEPAVPGWPE